MTDTIRVSLGERSYDVRVGRGLIAQAGKSTMVRSQFRLI